MPAETTGMVSAELEACPTNSCLYQQESTIGEIHNLIYFKSYFDIIWIKVII